MLNVLITGVSGYLGQRLVQHLSGRDGIGALVGIDIVPPSRPLEKVVFRSLDIRDPGLEALLKQHNIDTVFHLAFVVSPIHDLARMHDIDYHGTRNVLSCAAAAGVKHVIAISSTLAYGAHPDNPPLLKEDDRLRGNPSFPYGFNKALVDDMMRDFAAGHPRTGLTILRPCTVFGPTVNNYVSRMLFLPLTVCIRGYDPPVQFVHEDDFVQACLLAAEKQIPGVYNIAGDGALSTGDIARLIGTKVIPVPDWMIYPLLELLWRLHVPGIEVNQGYLDYVRYPFVADNAKAKAVLGFTPRYTSLETLQDTIRSRRNG